MTFSSLDVHLHTEALLNTMNFLENLLPQTPRKGDGQEELLTIPKTDEGKKDGDMKEEVVVAKKKSKNKKSFSVRPVWPHPLQSRENLLTPRSSIHRL